MAQHASARAVRGAHVAPARGAPAAAARRTAPTRSAATPPTFQPLYRQVEALLIARLEAGEWLPGTLIPSEAELALRFNVSQGTVRKAVDAMAADNLVVRRQGKGTFVATHTEEKASLFRFLRIRANDGHEEYPTSRLLDVRRGKAGADVARHLGLRAGAVVINLRRLLEFSGEPVVLDDIVLPATLFRGLTRERVAAYAGSMYSLFETGFGVRILRAEERLSAVPADAYAAAQLKIRSGEPLLAVERVTYTYGDRAVEWRRGLCSTRQYAYVNAIG
jgi:GntR family transcriptional regulator